MTWYSVGVFKNKESNTMIMVPMGFTKDGIRVGVNKPIVINEPYTLEILGEKLKLCFSIIINKNYSFDDFDTPVHEIVTGIKKFSKFSKEHHYISPHFKPDTGYEFYESKRHKDGSYRFLDDDGTIKLPNDASEYYLGEAIIKTFELCE